MPTGSGLDAQIGLAAETTWNTGVTVTRFFPLVSETLKAEIDRIESGAIITGNQVQTDNEWAPGNKKVGGDTQFELYDQDMGLLLRLAFGTVNTASAGGTGTHTFFPASPSVSASVQVGRPTQYGSVIPATYTGAKIASWELAASQGEFLTFGATWLAAEETMSGTALASASYTSNMKRWRFSAASLSVDGTVIPVKDFKVSGDNKLAERRFLGSTIISEPLREDLAEYTGEFTPEWGGVNAMGTLLYDRYLNGTLGTLVFGMASGTLRATLTANTRFDGSTPNVAGRGIVEMPTQFKCVTPTTAGSNAIQVVLVNNQTTA